LSRKLNGSPLCLTMASRQTCRIGCLAAHCHEIRDPAKAQTTLSAILTQNFPARIAWCFLICDWAAEGCLSASRNMPGPTGTTSALETSGANPAHRIEATDWLVALERRTVLWIPAFLLRRLTSARERSFLRYAIFSAFGSFSVSSSIPALIWVTRPGVVGRHDRRMWPTSQHSSCRRYFLGVFRRASGAGWASRTRAPPS
jgi:hypothetical protein